MIIIGVSPSMVDDDLCQHQMLLTVSLPEVRFYYWVKYVGEVTIYISTKRCAISLK